MNLAIFLALLLISPFNLLALKSNDLMEGNFGKKNDSASSLENQGGSIMGLESEVSEKMKEDKSQEKLSPSQPVRFESARDLVLPNAHASLILDAESGTILHYQNGREHRQIASLTKMMTAILVMEKINNLNEPVTIESDEVFIEGTKIGCPRSGYCISNRLRIGEKITAENLLKAMLMNSANDAATALGRHISGSKGAFVELMNQRADELGLRDTHFCTPSGLETDGNESECYSSAYDIARIAAYALKYDKIWEIFRLPNNLEIASCDGMNTHTLINTDLVLDTLPNCLGAKTGFTPLAGHSLLLVASDESGKNKIITVLLNDPYRWVDVRAMVDWAFKSHEWK
jgi:serine-type D-Ala-D-Ala carboxypeptidase (penicillin-binding protein 5/6)